MGTSVWVAVGVSVGKGVSPGEGMAVSVGASVAVSVGGTGVFVDVAGIEVGVASVAVGATETGRADPVGPQAVAIHRTTMREIRRFFIGQGGVARYSCDGTTKPNCSPSQFIRSAWLAYCRVK
jgi:hypothetical protein